MTKNEKVMDFIMESFERVGIDLEKTIDVCYGNEVAIFMQSKPEYVIDGDNKEHTLEIFRMLCNKTDEEFFEGMKILEEEKQKRLSEEQN